MCIRVLICINQIDDESFNLWDTFNLTFALFVTIMTYKLHYCNIVIFSNIVKFKRNIVSSFFDIAIDIIGYTYRIGN